MEDEPHDPPLLASREVEGLCLQNKGMVEGRILYAPTELDQLAVASKGSPPKGEDERMNWEFRRAMYGRPAKEVAFLVPFDTKESTFRPRDSTGIRLNLLGERVELRQSADALGKVGPLPMPAISPR